jgi:hypothetical protein
VKWTDDDLRRLEAQGISTAEAERQIELLSDPGHYLSLVRPCTPGDGIVRLSDDEIPEVHALHAEAVGAGRVRKFVPASGAASRMFQSLMHFRHGPGAGTPWETIVREARDGQAAARELVTFVEGVRDFAFHDELRACLGDRGHDLEALGASGSFEPIVDALLGPDGLGYADRPKGLLTFHRYPGEVRTAFEEHLVQSADYARDAEGVCRLHFTILERHRSLYEATATRALRRRIAGDARFEIGYSVQKPSTDTLALDDDGRPARDAEGKLRFRPGGHGALIENLNDLAGDLVLVRNIDNVRPENALPLCSHWKRALVGHAVRLQRELFRHLERLRGTEPAAEHLEPALAFARAELCLDVGDVPQTATPEGLRVAVGLLRRALTRPLRVCGVVRNTGEPGGGPFWARDARGRVGLQIVETSQVDPSDDGQQRILRSSTHFNPVDLVCAVRDDRGDPFDLTRHVDPEAVIVARKSAAGRGLWALERPGLWNGAMADWITVFVEVPIGTFAPVKSVVDLLRPEHQPD